jgi:hypothetical protein
MGQICELNIDPKEEKIGSINNNDDETNYIPLN